MSNSENTLIMSMDEIKPGMRILLKSEPPEAWPYGGTFIVSDITITEDDVGSVRIDFKDRDAGGVHLSIDEDGIFSDRIVQAYRVTRYAKGYPRTGKRAVRL